MAVKAILLGDAMIPGEKFASAWDKILSKYGSKHTGNWESAWDKLQYRRLEVEKHGPEGETVDELILKEGKDADMLMGLFVPVSSKVMDAMPNLRLVGVSRAGLENVNVAEATKRGIAVFNVQGRNAHAVSDFTLGLILAAARNIAKAHYSIMNGEWRKTFPNSDYIPEIEGRHIGLVGFGHIGKLVARKLSGFMPEKIRVYDPYAAKEDIEAAGCVKVEDLDEVMKESDFLSIHARLTDSNKGMIGKRELGLMKKTAYLINTARAGLVDQDALVEALQNGIIMGAALDVFTTEPIPADSPYLKLDNVTLTTHIAGTTADALGNSPFLLAEDIRKFFAGEKANYIVNKEVLDNPDFKAWYEKVKN